MHSATNNALQKIIRVRAEQAYRLYVTLTNGEEIELDLTPLIETRAVFWRLKNFRYFRTVDIDPLGGLYWLEGEDISPTKIFYYATNSQCTAKHPTVTKETSST